MQGFSGNVSRESLAPIAENIATLLGGTALSAIDPAVRTDLLTLMGTLPADLDAANADIVVQQDQAKAAVSAANALQSNLETVLGQVFNNLKAGNAPKEQFDLCGFLYPFAARVAYGAPVAPSDLSAFGLSTGVNFVKFKGNNPSGYVTYEVWRRAGDDGPWLLHGTSTRQQFTDNGVTPGQYYEYKCRAKSKTDVSAFSGTAVVYGVVSPPIPPA